MRQKELALSVLAVTFSTCVIAGDIKRLETQINRYAKSEQKICRLATVNKEQSDSKLIPSILELTAK